MMAITAKQADFPPQVWIGTNAGVSVFAFDSEDKARTWAAEPQKVGWLPRYILGPIDLDLDVEVRKAQFVPSTARWFE